MVQDTVVAGPPVEIQVRVSWSESYVRSPDIVMSPTIIPLGQPTTIYLMISTSVAIYIVDKLSVQWVCTIKKGEFLLLYLVSMECPSELQN